MSEILDIVLRHLTLKASTTRSILDDAEIEKVNYDRFWAWVDGGGELSSPAYILWCFFGCHGFRSLIQAHSSYRLLGSVTCHGCHSIYKLHSVRMVFRSRRWLHDHYEMYDERDGDEDFYDSIHFMQLLNLHCQECRFLERREFYEEAWWRATFHSPDCRCSECFFSPYVLA